MMLREFRLADSGQAFQLLTHEFPEEEEILGIRPEGFEKIVRRVFRWDTRLILGMTRLVGRPPFRFLVIADGDRIVGTTLLSFPPAAGYLSMVVVDPAHRRQGHAFRLIEEARRVTARRRPWVVLDVLEANAPARQLYERAGYRTLRAAGYMVHDAPASFEGAPSETAGIRPFHRTDAAAVAQVAQRTAPPEVARVLPVTPRALVGSGWIDSVLLNESRAWVVDRGRGPEAHVTAIVSSTMEAGHLSTPIVAETVDPSTATALVRTAAQWIATKGSKRIASMVPEENVRGRAALEEAGFHRAVSTLTLYRPSA